MKSHILYPIKFKPILQQKIWGGNKLITELNKKSNILNIGESWEISNVDNFVSKVVNGELKGDSLTALIRQFKGKLVGEKVYRVFRDKFPLLFKFIDANDDLSIQLHPNDKLAKKRHNSFGKTEMWYVVNAGNDSKLYAGFSRKINQEVYLKNFNQGDILDVIHVDKVKKGDAFFIDAGTIHAIGKDILIAEIQQTSDITYRIYDWDRVDSEGKQRELHTNLALEALDFSKVGSCKLDYNIEVNKPNQIYSCKYFTTNKLKINNSLNRDIKAIDSFIVYMCIEGEGAISVEGRKEKIKKGETLLIPGVANYVNISTDNEVNLLEVYI